MKYQQVGYIRRGLSPAPPDQGQRHGNQQQRLGRPYAQLIQGVVIAHGVAQAVAEGIRHAAKALGPVFPLEDQKLGRVAVQAIIAAHIQQQPRAHRQNPQRAQRQATRNGPRTVRKPSRLRGFSVGAQHLPEYGNRHGHAHNAGVGGHRAEEHRQGPAPPAGAQHRQQRHQQKHGFRVGYRIEIGHRAEERQQHRPSGNGCVAVRLNQPVHRHTAADQRRVGHHLRRREGGHARRPSQRPAQRRIEGQKHDMQPGVALCDVPVFNNAQVMIGIPGPQLIREGRKKALQRLILYGIAGATGQRDQKTRSGIGNQNLTQQPLPGQPLSFRIPALDRFRQRRFKIARQLKEHQRREARHQQPPQPERHRLQVHLKPIL